VFERKPYKSPPFGKRRFNLTTKLTKVKKIKRKSSCFFVNFVVRKLIATKSKKIIIDYLRYCK